MTFLEHIGIAVDDADAVVDLYHELAGLLPYKSETVEAQQVRTHFLAAGSAKLELLEATAAESPVASYVQKRGEGLHHLAFEVDDADATMQRLREAGYQPLGDAPSRGADGKRIFFLHPKQTHGVLVEFCESTPVAWSPATIPYREGHLAVYEAGRATLPPVLLLHGAGGSTQLETTPLMRHLEQHFHVLAVDFTGHGASATLPETGEPEFTADLLADNARAALDAFDIKVANVFGFSLGGNMALQLARRHPDRVGRLAVHGANVSWSDDLVDAMTARLDADTLQSRSARLTERLDQAHPDWRALFDQLQTFVRQLPALTKQMQDATETVSHPALVSAVDRDDLFPLDAPLSLQRHLPNARLAVLPGDHHALPQAPIAQLAGLLNDHFGA